MEAFLTTRHTNFCSANDPVYCLEPFSDRRDSKGHFSVESKLDASGTFQKSEFLQTVLLTLGPHHSSMALYGLVNFLQYTLSMFL